VSIHKSQGATGVEITDGVGAADGLTAADGVVADDGAVGFNVESEEAS
nr:hypothetical protein [Tanacetum cinerariifolium]